MLGNLTIALMSNRHLPPVEGERPVSLDETADTGTPNPQGHLQATERDACSIVITRTGARFATATSTSACSHTIRQHIRHLPLALHPPGDPAKARWATCTSHASEESTLLEFSASWSSINSP